MNFDLVFEATYPHPIEKVWAALTDARALSAWLNETDDFEPVAGRAFQMRCAHEDGSVDVYLCRVLALEPPRAMDWSWHLEGAAGEPTRVEYRLEPVAGGTRLTVRHSGDRPAEVAEFFRSGWPAKLEALRAALP